MEAVGVKIVAAVDSRDTAALMELGGELDEACEACHTAFWYPEEAAAKTAADAAAQPKNLARRSWSPQPLLAVADGRIRPHFLGIE
jgi:hypothetical protein